MWGTRILLKRNALIFSAFLSSMLSQGRVFAGTMYNSIPSPLPGNVPSWGYQATGTAEFGAT